jgi:hypothetical protein
MVDHGSSLHYLEIDVRENHRQESHETENQKQKNPLSLSLSLSLNRSTTCHGFLFSIESFKTVDVLNWCNSFWVKRQSSWRPELQMQVIWKKQRQ